MCWPTPAQLDDGPMWAAGFALTDGTAEVEERIAELVAQAVHGSPAGNRA